MEPGAAVDDRVARGGLRPGGHVAIASAPSPAEALAHALDRARLWPLVEEVRAAASVGPGDLRAVIVPDLGTGHPSDPATRPELVERLVELLAERGVGTIAIAGAPEERGASREPFASLAERGGYRGVTAGGRHYERLDLSEGLAPAAFPPGCVLAGTPLSRAWTEAHLRIVFARCHTDDADGYALCLAGLLGVLPLRHKRYHYRRRLRPWDVCLELLRHTPVHLALIDAWECAGGVGARLPVATRTVIAGDDLLLVDWVGAVKMGLDPQASRLNAHALARAGLPRERRVEGDLAPFAGLRTVHPLVADSFRQLEDAGDAAALLEAGPERQGTAAWLPALAARLAHAAEGSPAARLGLLGLNYWAASLGKGTEAWRTLWDKDAILREEVPLGLDLDAYAPADYDAVPSYLLPLEALIRSTPPDGQGLRWRYLEGSVLVEYERVLPIPFSELVARVDVAQAVQCMKDYLGGRCVPVARDGDGRVLHQAERTRYLPQPNWLALYGAPPIDVAKLERIVREPGAERIFWRTVKSENGSARHDDGIVTFAEAGAGTRITVLALQEFTLPPFWQAMRLELLPEVRDALVAREYLAYLQDTLTQLQARYEGRDLRVGHPGRTEDGREPAPAGWPGPGSQAVTGALARLVRGASGAPGTPPPEVDGDGFRHFVPAPDEPGVAGRRARAARLVLDSAMRTGTRLAGFLGELRAALRADLGREE